jgi:uncharacterized protein
VRVRQQQDPRRVDVQALAVHGSAIEGRVALADLPRLCDSNDDPAAPVIWSAQASRPERPEADALVHLHVVAQADVTRHCQRCLEPMPIELRIDRRLRFVRSEEQAARLDAESDDDVLALAPALDMLELIEDELLLELPLVPRHDRCVDLASLGSRALSDAVAATPNPFQALAGLKRGKTL